MNKKEFEKNMRGAKAIAELSENPLDAGFWSGYQRGLRRLYHGDAFGTQDEHAKFMAAAGDTNYPDRRILGVGYRMGFEGASISAAMDRLAMYKSQSRVSSVKKPPRKKVVDKQ